MRKLRNWDRIKDLLPEQTMRNRDVYEDQQFERSTIGEKKTMKSRIIADIAMSIFFFFVFWLLYSIGQYGSFLTHGGKVSGGVSNFFMGWVYFIGPSFGKIFFDFAFTGMFYGIMYLILKHNLDTQNALMETADINQYPNDQHIALPEEIQRKFDWFPDVGATSDVQVSSMISHMALSNKGLNKVRVAKRAEADILDENGEIEVYKGEVLRDDAGEVIYEDEPVSMIDIAFMKALFMASGIPKMSKNMRKFYDASKIPYNGDGSDREKLGKYETVADLINADWQLPYYEPQRPGGAYIVDTAPVNTMVLAITRAGKG